MHTNSDLPRFWVFRSPFGRCSRPRWRYGSRRKSGLGALDVVGSTANKKDPMSKEAIIERIRNLRPDKLQVIEAVLTSIEHGAATGLGVYDFLAGDHRYKDSLSTGNGQLVWCKVQRPRWRFSLEDRLVDLVRSVRNRRS